MGYTALDLCEIFASTIANINIDHDRLYIFSDLGLNGDQRMSWDAKFMCETTANVYVESLEDVGTLMKI